MCCLQGARCCVVGNPETFFTLYQTALACGGRVCHLDRDGRLAASGAAGEALAEAVEAAAAGAACLLVASGLAARRGFPWAAFQGVVVYASEAGAQAALRERLAGAQCAVHILEVAPPSLDAAAPVAAPAAAPAAKPQLRLPAPPPAGDGKVRHAARTAPAAGVIAGLPPAAVAACGMDWPLVISCDPSRPIR